MYIAQKHSNGITLVSTETSLFSERKLFIEGPITSESACEFVRCLMILANDDTHKPIDIYINSPGGDVMAGLMIYDTIKGLDIELNLHCVGIAASMAAIIMAGGKKGHRFILPHSKMMIHEPLITDGVGGSATTFKRTAEVMMEIRRTTVELLADDTGKGKRAIEAAISYDNYMNAEEAIAFGLCDSIETSLVKEN